MIPLSITPNIDNAPWTECQDVTDGMAVLTKIGLLPNGTASGQPTVNFKLEMADGRVMVGETSWKLFRAASAALHAAIETYDMMRGVEDG